MGCSLHPLILNIYINDIAKVWVQSATPDLTLYTLKSNVCSAGMTCSAVPTEKRMLLSGEITAKIGSDSRFGQNQCYGFL